MPTPVVWIDEHGNERTFGEFFIPRDFITEVAMGNIPGHFIMRGLGERDSISTTAAGEDIWYGNELSATPSLPASHTFIPRPAELGEQMTVISESNADNGATATGVLTMTVVYLDGGGNQKITEVTMNGTTAVDLEPSDVSFVQDMQALTVGSNTVAEGNIRIYNKANDTLVYSMIKAGGNQSLVPNKMVPSGKTLFLKNWLPSEATNAKRITVRLRADCSNSIPPVRQPDVFLFKSVARLDSSIGPFELGYAIPSRSVVKASAWAKVSGAEVAVHWWGVLIDNDLIQ